MSTNKQPPIHDDTHPLHEKCDWKYCRSNAELYPVLVMPLPAWHKGAKKMEMPVELSVCAKHADPEHLEWYMTDENWEEICKNLFLRKFPVPEREKVHVIFKALEDRSLDNGSE